MEVGFKLGIHESNRSRNGGNRRRRFKATFQAIQIPDHLTVKEAICTRTESLILVQ